MRYMRSALLTAMLAWLTSDGTQFHPCVGIQSSADGGPAVVAVPDISNSAKSVIALERQNGLERRFDGAVELSQLQDDQHNQKRAQHTKRKKAVTPKKKKKKKKPKAVTVPSFLKCNEAYNGLFDVGICRRLELKPPTMESCFAAPSKWRGRTETVNPLSSMGEFTSGVEGGKQECAASIYNQGAKTAIKFEREVFGAWWQAAAQQCLYPGSGYDSAYCTYVEDDPVTGQRKVGPIILAMSRTGHNKDFKADYLSGGQA